MVFVTPEADFVAWLDPELVTQILRDHDLALEPDPTSHTSQYNSPPDVGGTLHHSGRRRSTRCSDASRPTGSCTFRRSSSSTPRASSCSPSFRRPHFTVRLDDVGERSLRRLLEARVVHLRVLPGAIEDYEALVRRATTPA